MSAADRLIASHQLLSFSFFPSFLTLDPITCISLPLPEAVDVIPTFDTECAGSETSGEEGRGCDFSSLLQQQQRQQQRTHHITSPDCLSV